MSKFQQGGRSWPLIFPCLLIVVTTLIAYWGVWHFQLINYDDDRYIGWNQRLHLNLANIVWSMTSVWFSNWYPLTWISYMVDFSLFHARSGGYHLTNLLLHIASCLILFAFLLELTGDRLRSLIVALLFAVHPLHIQSVAWVGERKDCLSALFFAATLLAYRRYVVQDSRKWYGLTLLFFAAGLASKSMLITIPPLLMILDYCVWKRFALKEKLPMFAMALATGIVGVYAQRVWGSTVTHLPFSMSFANAIVSYVRYLVKLFWPANLAIFYPFPSFIPWQVSIGSAAVLAALSILFLRQKNVFVQLGWGWFLLTLVPVIGFLKLGISSNADRYMYLPSIGCFVVAAWAVKDRRWLIPLSAAAILACVVVSRLNIFYWKDSIALWEHALQVTQNSF